MTEARPATPAEIHDQKAKQLEDQAKLNRAAAAFLAANPAFDEFLKLLKTGVFN